MPLQSMTLKEFERYSVLKVIEIVINYYVVMVKVDTSAYQVARIIVNLIWQFSNLVLHVCLHIPSNYVDIFLTASHYLNQILITSLSYPIDLSTTIKYYL